MRGVRYFFEGVLAWVLYWFFWLIGVDAASALGARIAKCVGPLLKVHRTAEKNLARAMPELSEEARKKILQHMWENLGRVAGEAPHIPSFSGKKFVNRVGVEGEKNLESMKNSEKGGIFFSGHFANWELAPKTAYQFGLPLVLMYRPANNPWVEKLYRLTRRKSHAGLFPKGKEGAVAAIRALKEKKVVGMLVDQKMNEGIPVPFFGRDAMTASAMAELALKYDAPLIPARVIRTEGAHFKVIVYPPLKTEGKDGPAIMREVHAMFESWIREQPAQWMWVHNRWPKDS